MCEIWFTGTLKQVSRHVSDVTSKVQSMLVRKCKRKTVNEFIYDTKQVNAASTFLVDDVLIEY